MENKMTPKQALEELEEKAKLLICNDDYVCDLVKPIYQALTELEEIKQTMYSWEVKDTKQLNVALGEWTCGIKRQTNEDVKEEPILVKEDETDCQVVGHKQEKTLQECIESLECLFKSYQKDSEFNYQLSVNNSPFNIIKRNLTEHEKQTQILEVLKEHFVNRDNDTSGLYFEKHIGYYEPYYQIKLKDGIKLTFTETEFNLIREWLK